MNTTKPTIASIQLLRGLAALSVVWVHSTTISQGYNLPVTGNFGVDIFFVISGFIIAYMLQQSTKKFFIKRINRIVPLYTLITIALFASRIFLSEYSKVDYTMSVSDILYLIKSILFIPTPGNITAPGVPVLSVGGTLNYEMLFYLITFICILFIKNKKYIVIGCATIICAWVAVLNLINTDSNVILNFYKYGHGDTVHTWGFASANLGVEFVYGIALYYSYNYVARKECGKKLNQKIKIVFCLIVALISYGLMVYSDLAHFGFTSERGIVYGIPALVLVAAILFLEQNIQVKINSKIIKFGLLLGEISYAIYLVHFNVLLLLDIAFWNKVLSNNALLPLEISRIIVAFVVIICVSIVVHKYIDMPIQNYLRKRLKKD